MTQQIPRNLSAKDLNDWLLSDAEKPVLVDVREENELAIAPFPSTVLHLPLSQANVWIKELPSKLQGNQPVVVICHSGIRSLSFANWLIEQNWSLEVWNLEGGIDSWSLNVDSSVSRY